MTKTDFAELKEKLGKFDPKLIDDLCNDRWASYEMFEAYLIIAKESAKEQHTKSAAIISELIEIISFQDNKISELLNYLHHNEDNLVGDDLIGDQRFTKRFNNYTKSTSDVLSETTTRLQKLRDGK